MIVLDVETTGTEAAKHSLVSIGAVDFMKPERQFYGMCRIWEGAHIMSEALAVNGMSEKEIRDPNKKTDIDLVAEFLKWADECENHTIAGQNPSFDIDFIKWTCLRNNIHFPLPHRSVDLHSITYSHMIKRGLKPPQKNKRTDLNSDTIMTYVGIPAEPKPHVASNGALWETEAFSRLLNDRSIFPQFEKYKIPWPKTSF